mmetsp:Transcript_25701/g.42774  ORF Transcript_25701/g.42774 Transcript_25701/m.42774 type:complete len:200 (-) Transcript_25701:385-984(-)
MAKLSLSLVSDGRSDRLSSFCNGFWSSASNPVMSFVAQLVMYWYHFSSKRSTCGLFRMTIAKLCGMSLPPYSGSNVNGVDFQLGYGLCSTLVPIWKEGSSYNSINLFLRSEEQTVTCESSDMTMSQSGPHEKIVLRYFRRVVKSLMPTRRKRDLSLITFSTSMLPSWPRPISELSVIRIVVTSGFIFFNLAIEDCTSSS